MKNYTTKEVAELFDVSERTIQRHIATLIENLKNPLNKALSVPSDIVNLIASRHGYDKMTTDSDSVSELENDYPTHNSKISPSSTLIKTVQNDNTSDRPQTKSKIRNSQKHSRHSAKNNGQK